MSPNKRRMTTSDEDEENFKNRRSSLRVNLSYCTNLSDSGNGSLGRTQTENDERRMNRLQINKRLSSSKHQCNTSNRTSVSSERSKCSENDVSKLPLQIKEGIQLKRLTINLEDINAKEQILAINCKRLKDAILNKTKEIFNKQDELSVKTAMVLANQEDCSVSNMRNLNTNKLTNQYFENKGSVTCSQYNDTVNNQQGENAYPDIDATPKNGERRRNSENAVNRSKLTPKRLFTEKGKKQECRIIEDIVLDKPFLLFPLKQADRSDSPILSGSNRRLQLLRSRSKLFSQSQSKDHNNSPLTVYSDHSINIGQPVTCSTFIEDNAKDEEEGNNNPDNKVSQQGDLSQDTHTINTLISMEMTKAHGSIYSIGKHSSLPSKDSYNSNTNTKKKKCNSESVEKSKNIMSVQRLENINSPLNKLALQNNSTLSGTKNNRNVTAVCANTTVVPTQSAPVEEITLTAETRDVLQAQEQNNQIKKQNKRQCTLSLSDSNSIRSSLNVNTSLDVVTETSERKSVQKSGDRGIIVTNRHIEVTTNNEEILDNQRESINTNRTSLQVNTSMDSMCKTRQKNSDCRIEQFPIKNKSNKSLTDHSSVAENTEANDIDFLENISLIERLRNISTRNQASHNNELEIPETRNKKRTEDVRSNNVISTKFQSANNNSRNSYVEGTPYPISRSVLFKKQLKHKTLNSDNNSMASCSNDSTSANNEKNNSGAKSNDLNPTSILYKTHMLTVTSRKIEDDTVVLEDTLDCNPFIVQEKTTVIEDSLDKTGLDETNKGNTIALQNAENVTTRRGKKRLMPLHENSQLCSIEMLEEYSDMSEKSMTIKRNKKKLKKKRSKKKTEDSKNDTTNIKNNIANEQVSLNDDYDITEDKKKENKKTKKPRKIISKKIVIKKFVNESALRIMEESRRNKGNLSMENRDSSNDFVTHRMIPTQRNKYKSQKIVIVTTGLSKGDKSLVKSIVKSLGMAEMELNVSRRTTHVVSTGVRTVNLLRAIIRGCWLITLEWVLKSLESNVWLNPEEFEMKHFSKAVLENRKDRQLFGPSYIPELFTTCGLIHVEHKTVLPYDTLKELIKTAGGHITENPKLARITVGANGLKETWIIDSITTGELQSTKFYQRK